MNYIFDRIDSSTRLPSAKEIMKRNVVHQLFGVDISPKLTKIAKANMLLGTPFSFVYWIIRVSLSSWIRGMNALLLMVTNSLAKKKAGSRMLRSPSLWIVGNYLPSAAFSPAMRPVAAA